MTAILPPSKWHGILAALRDPSQRKTRKGEVPWTTDFGVSVHCAWASGPISPTSAARIPSYGAGWPTRCFCLRHRCCSMSRVSSRVRCNSTWPSNPIAAPGAAWLVPSAIPAVSGSGAAAVCCPIETSIFAITAAHTCTTASARGPTANEAECPDLTRCLKFSGRGVVNSVCLCLWCSTCRRRTLDFGGRSVR
ncbi:hypothetical protein LMG23994_05174 [Cupriavidus pinatubonensis]|uniref:Uncharacterized protein n=1 Tax=Cupriavidus pinatubonensis TaxID=248026 RepID=A0ABM8XTA9_9BURK|nr:hypothetical protein LMG23994_05174 [Cupriavidus pinatubonensis]